MPHSLPSIDLSLPAKLRDPEYRKHFFLAEASSLIARQLIALRKRRGLSQKELAKLANTAQPAISRSERADYSNWSFNTLRGLAEAMDARIRVLIEPAEDVLSEYEPAAESSDSTRLGGKGALSAFEAMGNRYPSAEDQLVGSTIGALGIGANRYSLGQRASSGTVGLDKRPTAELPSA